jgi:hypothetical protein
MADEWNSMDDPFLLQCKHALIFYRAAQGDGQEFLETLYPLGNYKWQTKEKTGLYDHRQFDGWKMPKGK